MRFPRPIRRAYAFVREVVVDYSKDNGALVAAAVSFYVYLSLVPILLLAIAVAGYVLGSPDRAQTIVFGYLKDYSPTLTAQGSGAIQQVVQEVVEVRGAATGIGLLVLLWTASSAFANLEKAINVAYNVTERRNILKTRLLAISIPVLVGLLLAASFVATAGLKAIRSLDVQILGLAPAQWPWIWSFGGYLIPLLVTIGAFTIIYKIMPNTYVPTKVALAGGVVAGILWELAKQAFSFYVSNYANYSKVYGSLAGVILLMVWINYSAVVTMLGAEVASVTARRRPRTTEAE